MSNLNSRLSRYGGTTKEQLEKNDPSTRRNTNAISYLKNDVPVFKPKEDDEKRVRVLPTDQNLFYYPCWVHFGMGPDFDSYPCLRMKNEACPLCEYSRKMYTDGDKVAGYKFKAANQNMFRLVDRKAEGDKAFIPHVLGVSNTVLDVIQNLMIDMDDNSKVTSIDNLLQGRDLGFTKKKTGKFIDGKEIIGLTDFKISGKDTRFGTDAQIEKILDYLDAHPIADIFNFTSAEEMAFRSGIADDEGEDEPEEDDMRSAPTKKEAESVSESESESEPEEEKKPEPVAAGGGSIAEKLAALKAKASKK